MGKIVENFVVAELKKQATWNKTITQLYHCRTTNDKEVDIILEDRSGNIIGIEVKGSEKIISDDFKGLKYLQERMNDRFIAGIVLSTNPQHIPFANKLHALPISALWNSVWKMN